MEKPKHDKQDIENNKVTAGLSYVFLLVFVPLFLKKGSPYCQFHARQGLILLVCWFALLLIGWIPVIGFLAFLFVIIMSIWGIKNALEGKYWTMPILGKYAEKINL